jgi:hypothetical protein
VIAVAVCVEVYGYTVAASGGEASPVLKLLYIPIFVWLLAESWKSRDFR